MLLPLEQINRTIFPTLKEELALAGVAQWIEWQPTNQRVTGLISSQGTCLGLWARFPVGGV